VNIQIVIASINELLNLKCFKSTLENNNCEVIIVDEGDEKMRKKNDRILDLPHKYYGPSERKEWFKQHFGSSYQKHLSVIPQRCHAETSFGFLVAHEERADVVIELDDDVFPVDSCDLVDSHLHNLLNNSGVKVSSNSKWYNTLESLVLDGCHHKVFPRGHPYSPNARLKITYGKKAIGKQY